MTHSTTQRGLAVVVGVLAAVEFTSGVLQGYYTPMLSDIARHLRIHDADVNWLEGAQLMLSALVVPAFAKLGDLVGHKRMLVVSTALTAAAALALPFAHSFGVFLVAWALMGFYVVWLPLEIALIWSRSRTMAGRSALTARAAGILIASLALGAITGALVGGALVDALPLATVLLVPAVLVVICLVVILVAVEEAPGRRGGAFDAPGFVLVAVSLVCLIGGLGLLRLGGGPVPWIVVLVGVLTVVPFARRDLRQADPLIDVRMFRSSALRPVFLTAALFGVSVLGAQAPLSTFVRTDPGVYGYGLGMRGFATSLIIGVYLVAMMAGALLFPIVARRTAPRVALMAASALVGLGFLSLVLLHNVYGHVVANMVVVGLGSGALAAALPAAAASAAPAAQTGVATGLTNLTKVIGGAIASCGFGIALIGGVDGAATGTAGALAGYLTVWVVCSATAFVAAVLFLFAPRHAFTDRAAAQVAVDPVPSA